MWSFDGSSTRQAEGNSSDCLLKPVAIFNDPARTNGYLVMTEVLNSDGTPMYLTLEQQLMMMTMTFGLDLSKNTLSWTRTSASFRFLLEDTLGHKAFIILLVEETHTVEILLRNMQIYVWKQASILKE